jgi:hypothetical protein
MISSLQPIEPFVTARQYDKGVEHCGGVDERTHPDSLS